MLTFDKIKSIHPPMKRCAFLFFLLSFVCITDVKSQTGENGIGISVKALLLDYTSQNGGEITDFKSYHTGFEIGFIKNIIDPINIYIPIKVGVVQGQDGIDDLQRSLFGIDAQIQYQFVRDGAAVIPYLTAGLGYVIERGGLTYGGGTINDPVNNLQIPAGFGLKFRAENRTYVTWQSEYRLSLEDDRDNLHHSLGITYYFGQRDSQEETMEDKPEMKENDSDGDGIIDELDLCPQEAGLEAFDGCPDMDNDSIPDYKDLCPDVAGPLELKGCPDSDGDGVSDNDDECPNMVGSPDNNGCPDNDADSDGIPNDIDRCPTVPGPASNNGCPEVDSDGDGIPDSNDLCPDLPGDVSANGCPDSDNDGIQNAEDKCPTLAGTRDNDGCPDEDADSDGDGVPDIVDRCPDSPGLSLYAGCPDSDGDGIDDSRDACPNTAGVPENQGCPEGTTVPTDDPDDDTDGDGVLNKDDRCPSRPGLPVYDGCPDSDGDGIDDSRDRCPNSAGPVDLGGCPEISPSDRRILQIAMRSVQFESGKAEIKSESFNILVQIAEIMQRYPDFNLSIEGHTDDLGSAENNQGLSELRARACYNFLASSGVARDRMAYVGYGESRPIATNQTISGRTLNRRVEFALIPKN